MQSPTVGQLGAVLADASQLLSAITAEQWAAPTPCEGWDLQTLVAHLVGGNDLFAAALRGQEAAPAGLGDDLPAAFDRSRAALIAAFESPGALQRVVTVPFGTVPGEIALHLRITEVLVHGWDIAHATGQRTSFDEAIAEQELQFTQAALGGVPPDRRPFGPPQQAPSDASAVEQLAAMLGRSVR